MVEILNNSLLPGAVILLISVIMSQFSNKFGVPVLILFLGIGIAGGKEGLGIIEYSNYELTHSAALLAICMIIFSGGLMTKLDDIKPILLPGASLSTFGVLHTTVFTGGFCYFFLKLPIYECLLIGAILSSTDASAVFTAFSGKKSQINKRVKSILEMESGSNDPFTFLLVTLFLGLYQAKTYSAIDTIELLILNPVIGFAGGYLSFKAFKFINDKMSLDFQGLYSIQTIAFLFLNYSLTTKLNGNGFLAVYIFAILMGNSKMLHKKPIMDFFDGASWLAQIVLFISLGLLVSPSRLANVSYEGSIVALFLIFVARPLATFLSTYRSSFNVKEKLLISWGGLKGATPIVFACLVADKMNNETNLLFDIVFFTVVFSAILQGSTLKPLAKLLNLQFEVIEDPKFPIDQEVWEKAKNGIKEVTISELDFACGKRVIDINLPSGTLVLFLKRNSSFIIPNGSTEFEENDRVLIVTPLKSDIDFAVDHFKKNMELVPNDSELSEEDLKEIKEVEEVSNIVELKPAKDASNSKKAA